MQQAYLSAYAHLDQFAGMARFPTWLTRIAVREALGRRRQRQRRRSLPDAFPFLGARCDRIVAAALSELRRRAVQA